MQLASIDDKADYKTVNEAIKQIGFTKQASTFWKIVAAVIHLVGETRTIFGQRIIYTTINFTEEFKNVSVTLMCL